MSRIETVQPAPAPFELRGLQRWALIAGVVGLVLCVVGATLNSTQFFQSYLWAYLFWFGIAMGTFGIMMIQHVSGGRWGMAIRRLLEAGAMTIPLMAVLFIPILLGIPTLYEWSHADVVQHDAVLAGKQIYLNVGFFIGRAVFYFAVWILMSFLLNRWSVDQDRTENPKLPRRFRLLSAPGLVIYMLTMTFAVFDWAMSLEPHWFSTIYGAMFVMGQAVSSLSFVIVIAVLLRNRQPLAARLNADLFNDLGNLLLAFTMLWAYMSFSQFLIIWSGDLPEEVTWYLHRSAGGWMTIATLLIVVHFFAPFFLLLIRNNKRRPQLLIGIALLLLVMHLINIFWLVIPAFYQTGIHASWMDLAAPIGIGGIWIAAYIWCLQRKPLLPLHDPRWKEGTGHHE